MQRLSWSGFGFRKSGFTVIELLAVMAIVGLLTGLLLVAVQQVREAARRTTCSNNLRQLGLGLGNYESAHRCFPLGATSTMGHSWSSFILPFIEQEPSLAGIDLQAPWNDPANQPAILVNIPVFACPTSFKDYAGFTDYCGIAGSWLATTVLEPSGMNGVLFPASDSRTLPVRHGDISDGLSRTIAVAEGIAVTEENFGFWGCGWHCFTHEDGSVNNLDGGYNEIASFHPGGANVLFCDGTVHFLDSTISGDIVSALCTRGESELTVGF